MPKVALYDNVGLGLIIQFESGVTYSNQTGGISYLSPEFEGVYVPFRNDYTEENHEFMSPELDLLEYFEGPKWKGTGAVNGIDEDDANFIQSILDKSGLGNSIEVNRKLLKDSHEAWVNVIIKSNESLDYPVFEGFEPYPRNGVLTWCNSD